PPSGQIVVIEVHLRRRLGRGIASKLPQKTIEGIAVVGAGGESGRLKETEGIIEMCADLLLVEKILGRKEVICVVGAKPVEIYRIKVTGRPQCSTEHRRADRITINVVIQEGEACTSAVAR